MIEGFPVATLTAPALLGITVLLLLLGKLVPRSTMQDKIQEADRWHQAYETERKARAEADAQTKELLEVAHLTHAIINSMFVQNGTAAKEVQSDVVEK